MAQDKGKPGRRKLLDEAAALEGEVRHLDRIRVLLGKAVRMRQVLEEADEGRQDEAPASGRGGRARRA